jgi:hypothetical protein
LEDFLWAIRILMTKAGWTDAAQFRQIIGTKEHRITLVNKASGPCPASNANCTTKNADGSSTITLIDLATRRSKDSAARQNIAGTFIHELAHAWDNNQGGKLSQGLRDRAYYEDENGRAVRKAGAGRPVSKYGENSKEEDWAESVAAVVFEDEPTRPSGSGQYFPYYRRDSLRSRYVRAQFGSYPDSPPNVP